MEMLPRGFTRRQIFQTDRYFRDRAHLKRLFPARSSRTNLARSQMTSTSSATVRSAKAQHLCRRPRSTVHASSRSRVQRAAPCPFDDRRAWMPFGRPRPSSNTFGLGGELARCDRRAAACLSAPERLPPPRARFSSFPTARKQLVRSARALRSRLNTTSPFFPMFSPAPSWWKKIMPAPCGTIGEALFFATRLKLWNRAELGAIPFPPNRCWWGQNAHHDFHQRSRAHAVCRPQ